MKKIAMIISLVCASLVGDAQTNYVKNPSFEDTLKCPDEINQIGRAKYWTCAVDTAGDIDGHQYYAPELYHSCSGTTWPIRCGVPENAYSIQFAHTGNAYIGSVLYYDKTLPAPPFVSTNWRDYAQGHLHKPLQNGKTYCISFWVVMAETSGYGQDNIGAYLDNGDINKRSPAGIEITDVVPQVYSTTIIKDTQNWVKVEGTFTATGNETHITLGNFAKQADVDTTSDLPYYAFLEQFSYYLFDDISVTPIDLAADAGKDSHAELGKKVQIGRVGDTTAIGLDCKWYKRGILIDSGATISVNSGASLGVIDTYLVVQTVCGLVKTDTVMVKTVPVGIPLPGGVRGGFSVYPNPSTGVFTLAFRDPSFVGMTAWGSGMTAWGSGMTAWGSGMTAWGKVYDLLGRVVYQKELSFANNQSSVDLNVADGIYILELSDSEGNVSRQTIEVRN